MNNPWEASFDRMPVKERRLVLHIADQLGKRQYYNAIMTIGELTQECIRGLKYLQEKLNNQ